MIFLLFSILTNAAIYLLFKYFDIKGIKIFEAIVANYITAFSIGIFMVDDLSVTVNTALQWPIWSVAGISLGGIFIAIFYFMAITAQKVGVSVATIASKMSLALAVILFALTDPNETIGTIKTIAILLAIAGVVFASLKDAPGGFNAKMIIYPLIILLGSTVIDFSIAHFSNFPTNENEMNLYSCLPFMTAGLIGITVIIIKYFKGNYSVSFRDIAAGIFLGLVNYGSIYFLVKSYTLGIWPKSTVLPLNNLSVVIVGAFASILIFKEKLSAKNYIGIALSALALALLLFTQ